MARQLADVQIHAADSDDLDDFSLDISVDLIDDGLYLGILLSLLDKELKHLSFMESSIVKNLIGI